MAATVLSPSPSLQLSPSRNQQQMLGTPIQATSSSSMLFGTPAILEPFSQISPRSPKSPKRPPSGLLLPSNLHPQASFHITGEGICPPPEIPHGPSQEHIELSFLDGADGTGGLPWLTKNLVESRRAFLGLNELEVKRFLKNCEFVGLGCFCGVTRALQALGLKRFSYPFDWVRSNVPGVICCLQSNFKDFTTYSFVGEGPAPGVSLYGGSKWGGSFWHHDPRDAKVQSSFDRRIKRLQGDAEIPDETSRVFLVALNALTDLPCIPKLRNCLQKMLPNAEIFLLVYMDNQPAMGPIRIKDDDGHTLLYWVHEEMFDEMGKTWSEQKHAEAYAEGLAVALRVWAGIDTFENIPEVTSFSELWNRCNNFDGGNPSEKLYWPMKQGTEKYEKYARQTSMPREKGSEGLYCSLPWPLNVILHPCGTDFDEEDDVEIIMRPKPVVPEKMGRKIELSSTEQICR